MPIMQEMAMSVFISFIIGWALGSFAVYSYLVLTARSEAFIENAEEDGLAEALESRAA